MDDAVHARQAVSAHTINVLLIDAEAAAAAELCEKLANAKGVTFSVETAGTLAKGLCLLEAKRFNAMLIDLAVDGSDGIPTLQSLQAHAGGIPILVTSSEYQDSDALE